MMQGTNDMEWYDPSAITTAGGSLVITISQKQTHDLGFQSGASSIHSGSLLLMHGVNRNDVDMVKMNFHDLVNYSDFIFVGTNFVLLVAT